jgi:hypothetical protein
VVRVDQRAVPVHFSADGGVWNDLGAFTVTGDSLAVRLSNDAAPEYLIADAIRIERLSTDAGTLINDLSAYYKLDDAPGTNRVDSTGHGNDLVSSTLPMVSSVPFTIGASSVGNYQALAGSLSAWGKWGRLLTVGERAALFNGGQGLAWPFAGASTLQDGLRAFWNLDESSASAVRTDATGRGNNLTPIGDPAPTAGPGSLGATYFNGAAQHLRRDSSSDLQGGNVSWEVAGWVKLDPLPPLHETVMGILEKYMPFEGLEWAVYYHVEHQRFQADLGDGVSLANNAVVIADNAGAPVVDQWYFLDVYYDAGANTLSIAVDNGVPNSTRPVAIPDVVPGKQGGASRYVNGRGGEQGFYDVPGTYYSSAPSSADLSGGNTDYTVAAWLRLDARTHHQAIMGKWNYTTNSADWFLFWNPDTRELSFYVSDGSGVNFGSASVPLNDSEWHLIVAWYDAATRTAFLRLDNHLQASSGVLPFTPAATEIEFRLGGASGDPRAERQFTGTVDAMGKWSRRLTEAEMSALWFAGDGIEFPFR